MTSEDRAGILAIVHKFSKNLPIDEKIKIKFNRNTIVLKYFLNGKWQCTVRSYTVDGIPQFKVKEILNYSDLEDITYMFNNLTTIQGEIVKYLRIRRKYAEELR